MDINHNENGLKFDFSKEAREKRRELANQRAEEEPILEGSDRATQEFLLEIGKRDEIEDNAERKGELIEVLVNCLSAVG